MTLARSRDRTQPAREQALAPGARVLIRNEEWVVRSVQRATVGGFAVHVTGVSELVRSKSAIFLTDLDQVTPLLPEKTELVADTSPNFRTSRLYLESLLRRSPPTEAALYVGHRAALRRTDYQAQPAQKALAQPRPRLLMADGVGLGKTVEVGILLSELIQRGRGERILVVALKSILAQFQRELWARFTIPLVRLDSIGIQRLHQRIPSNQNPFYYYDKVIISIDTLKKDAKYRRYLEQSHWDVVVVDECQNVAVRDEGAGKSQRARLAQLLATTCDGLILTSATPHDGRPESFASLLNLLEPTAIADPSSFGKEEAADLFIRRFKKDVEHEVGDAFRERQTELEQLPASPAENAVFDVLAQISFKTLKRVRATRSEGADSPKAGGSALFETQLLKAFLSSPAACLATLETRLGTLETKLEKNPGDEALRADIDSDREALLELRSLVSAVGPKSFTKLQHFLELLRDLGFDTPSSRERLILFSERIPTLRLLEKQLTKGLGLPAKAVQLFHGSLDDQAQRQLVESFGTDESPIRVLLCSDVASEGINLHHYCHRMVHFDLPWSLITLEQRNGRIDRFGQQSEPLIRYLLTVPSNPKLQGDLRVLERLIEKEDQAHKNLGDAAQLLRLWDSQREEEHIARGFEEGKNAEEILPDRSADEADDWLSDLFTEPNEPPPIFHQPLRLFEDDLSYVRTAFAELFANPGAEARVTWHDELQGFTLEPPEDLLRRYDYLPPELREQGTLKLTADRQRVMDSLEEARKKEGRWPEWQLLWELHPVCQWIDDRVLSQLTRHQAPVLQLRHALEAGEAVYVFQGVVSNRRGQPALIEWFGVPFAETSSPGDSEHSILPFSVLLEKSHLHDDLANPGAELDPDLRARLERDLHPAVERAHEHMTQLRRDRAEDMASSLRDSLRKLKVWQGRKLSELEKRRAKSGLGAARTKRFDEEQHRIENLYQERSRWVNEGLRTDPNPYLRLAAVMINPG